MSSDERYCGSFTLPPQQPDSGYATSSNITSIAGSNSATPSTGGSVYSDTNYNDIESLVDSGEINEADLGNGAVARGCCKSTRSVVTRPNMADIMRINDDTRCRALAKDLHARVYSMCWIETGIPPPLRKSGVLIRKTNNEYASEPKSIDQGLFAAVKKINPAVALTMSTDEIDAVFDMIQQGEPLEFRNGSQIQVFESLDTIAQSVSVKRFQYAALVCQERILLVWHNELCAILAQAMNIKERIRGLVSDSAYSPFGELETNFGSNASSVYVSSAGSRPVCENKIAEIDGGEMKDERDTVDISESESLSRPAIYTSAIYVALAVFLMNVLVLGFGNRAIMTQTQEDYFYPRLALILSEPVFLCLGLFFFIVIFNNCFQLCGPMTSMKMNSRFYSAIKPNLTQARARGFRPPPITIQMPIFTESLEGVIKPTVASLQAAISEYESRGGTAHIFINDDGMFLRSEADNSLFEKFYANNNIGWVSRPGHHHSGFVRGGKFKKASNMNYALNVSARVAKVLRKSIDNLYKKGCEVTERQETELYDDALMRVVEADPRIKAGGDIRIGAIILLVDSDTVVPKDCLIYGATEMFLSPEIAIIQHNTGVLQVSWDWFESGITYLTNLVYSSIRFAIGSGETAPFVGHNAFIRWRAVQDVADPPDDEGYVRFWSENNVSEDFDMAIRLQITGYNVRFASYHSGQFKEGISLSIFDELDRWEKYAYGCSELVFHPLRDWVWKGPLTPLFRKFLASDMQPSSKLTIIGYISSYFALASAVPLGLLNYFLIGWKSGRLDQFYVESWKVFVALLVVFNLISNVCLAAMRYRLREMGLLASLWENFKWMPFFMVFFGGLPLHLLLAISAHLFGVDMSWGATAKEKTKTSFWTEWPKICRRFKWMFALMFSIVALMIYLGCFAPSGKKIAGITSCIPMAVTVGMHILFPFVLNPSLMVFNY